MPGNRTIRFAAIGILAGAFSGLFGVGGGIVLVPLLLMLGFGERRATATSLCAIAVIAALAAALHGAYGNVRLGDAALLAVPAVAGVGIGVAVQQRLPERVVSLLFALLLIVVAAELIVP
ncbi:MAG: sulfite exporter TauE/SafE family protein [Solirubrobacterales bacterium]